MKRICVLFLCLLLLILCACGSQKEELLEPTPFYYCAKEISYNDQSGVIRAEQREAVRFQGNLGALLRAYLLGPNDPQLQTLIPSGVTVISYAIDGSCAMVTLSKDFSKLTGIKLSTACSSMLMTVHEYAGIDTLCVRAENSLLDDKDEITVTMEDILLLDSIELGE